MSNTSTTNRPAPTTASPIIARATARLSAAHEATRQWCRDRNAESAIVEAARAEVAP